MDLWVVTMNEIKMIVDDGIGTYLDCDDLYWVLYDNDWWKKLKKMKFFKSMINLIDSFYLYFCMLEFYFC